MKKVAETAHQAQPTAYSNQFQMVGVIQILGDVMRTAIEYARWEVLAARDVWRHTRAV